MWGGWLEERILGRVLVELLLHRALGVLHRVYVRLHSEREQSVLNTVLTVRRWNDGLGAR